MHNKEDRFKEILAENDDRIRRICSYYCHNGEDGKDLYQEVLTNIWKSLDRFRGDAAISTWVYRVAVNTALSFNGKLAKQMKFNLPAEQHSINALLADDGLNEKLKQEDQLNILEAELNQLSVIDKTIISLVLEALPLRQVADIIGITEPNVKVKLHRIKKELKDKLTNEKR